jgi:hypothetical protein
MFVVFTGLYLLYTLTLILSYILWTTPEQTSLMSNYILAIERNELDRYDYVCVPVPEGTPLSEIVDFISFVVSNGFLRISHMMSSVHSICFVRI